MNDELHQGLRDGKYMHVAPDWGVNTNAPVERLSWPTYRQVEQHAECDCWEPITPREPGPKNGVFTVPRINPAL
jgi:hypothetical protein